MRVIQVRTSTVKTLNFRSDHPDKQCKLRSACSLGISVIRVYTVAIMSAHCCNKPIIVGQGPAVLAAGTGLKLFDFWGVFFNFSRVLPGKEKVIFFLFWHFSIRYNVSFTKII